MKHLYILLLILVTSYSSKNYAQITDTVGNTPIRIDSLIGFTMTADDWPWDVEWGPDNSLWFTVGDKVCRYDTASHNIHVVLNRPDTTTNAMSIAFHPNFGSNPIVYVTYDVGSYYYSYSAGPIVLFTYDYSITGDSLYNETAILSWPHVGEHAGGRLHTGQDGYIYCTTAEYWPGLDTAGNLNGRILRINPDGSVPVINSHGDYPISYGHRNPQGIVQVPNGNIISSELGQQIDELNWIQDYHNYGWPAFDGDFCHNNSDSCTSPTFIYDSPIDTAIRPPSGITWYNHPAIPEFQGCVLQAILSFGGYQGGLVASKLNVAMTDVVSDVHYFKAEYLRWRDVTVSPDGKVYAITNDRQIPVIRVLYNPNYNVGIEEYGLQNTTIYPNPAINVITVSSDKNIGDWQMISIDGKMVKTGTVASSLMQVDVSALTPGIYFFRTEKGAKKFVKE